MSEENIDRAKVERLKNMSCFQIQEMRRNYSKEFTPQEISTAHDEILGKGFFKRLFPSNETQEKRELLHRLFMDSIVPTRKKIKINNEVTAVKTTDNGVETITYHTRAKMPKETINQYLERRGLNGDYNKDLIKKLIFLEKEKEAIEQLGYIPQLSGAIEQLIEEYSEFLQRSFYD